MNIAGVTTFTGQARFNGEVVAGGVISVNTGGSINIPDKLIHSGDTDTAIRFPAADTISFETAGTERLRIDSSGLIGIGLSVYSNTSASEYDGDANNLVVGTGSGNEGTVSYTHLTLPTKA